MQSLCVCFAFIGMEMMQSAVSVTKNTLWLVPAGIIHSQHFQAHNQTSVGLFREAAERSTWTEPKQTEQIPTRTREVIGLETWQRMRDSFAVSSVEAGVDITNQVPRVSCTSSGIKFQTVSHVYLCESGFYEPEPQLLTCSTLQLLNNCLRFMYRLHGVMWSILLAAHNFLKRF